MCPVCFLITHVRSSPSGLQDDEDVDVDFARVYCTNKPFFSRLDMLKEIKSDYDPNGNFSKEKVILLLLFCLFFIDMLHTLETKVL